MVLCADLLCLFYLFPFLEVFFFKAYLKPTSVRVEEQSISNGNNVMWLTKDELEQLLPKDYYDSIAPVLLQ